MLHVVRSYPLMGMSSAFLGRLIAARSVLRRLKPDLVHGQGTEAGYAWMATASGLPNVITIHGLLRLVHGFSNLSILDVRRLGELMEGATLKRATNIISISRFIESATAGTTNARFFRIPNAVRPTFYEVPLAAPAGDGRVLYVGRIAPEKGLLDLMHAAQTLDSQGVSGQVEVIGTATRDGQDYLLQCKSIAGSLRNVRILFMGARSGRELSDLLVGATCVVLPSKIENSPMVVAEAMAAGTPPVAYAVGGVPERIADGVDGFLIEPRDIAGLACRIGYLMRNPDRVTELGLAARQKSLEWTEDSVAERTFVAYQSILS
jgi:glycosyltransferase involved in cell wall biosynthesis